MYNPKHHRQPHLPPQTQHVGQREKRNFAQIGHVKKTGQKGLRLFVDVERYGGYDGVRIAHLVLSRTSGCVRFPIKEKKDDQGEVKEVAAAVILPIEGRPEDSVVLGYVDFSGNNDLLKRIAEYMEANPDHEFPWLDRHPAGQEIMQDGHGSWTLETIGGHTIKLIERDGQEAIEITTADKKPLTLRARGTGTVLLQSDDGNVEVLGGDKVRVLGKNTEVTAEENVDITAEKDAELSGENVNVLASKTLSIAASGDTNIGASGDVNVEASGKIAALSNDVKLGVEALVKKLVTEDIIALFNAHTHSAVATGAGSSGPPTVLLTSAQVATANTKAS